MDSASEKLKNIVASRKKAWQGQTDIVAPPQLNPLRCGWMESAAQVPHSNGAKLNGGPRMLEINRDGRRIYVTNSLYSALDQQF